MTLALPADTPKESGSVPLFLTGNGESPGHQGSASIIMGADALVAESEVQRERSECGTDAADGGGDADRASRTWVGNISLG